MPSDLVLRKQELIDNPTPRCPVCLVLDISPSMSGDTAIGAATRQMNPRPIDELNAGVHQFFNEVKTDAVARHSVEVGIVTFAGEARLALDFASLDRAAPPRLDIDSSIGGTSIGQGVQLAMDALEARKAEYKDTGVDYYQPWLVLMTDGQPTDETHHDVAPRVQELASRRKLHVFAIGIGTGADMNTLAMFSPLNQPLRLRGLEFGKFFSWLSASAVRTSQSTPGERIPLDKEGIKGWAEL
jgi:uncharacterized protein YegL